MSKKDGVSVSLKSGISLVGYKSKSFENCHIKLGKSWGEHELHMLVGIYFMRIKNLMVKARRSMNSEVVLADQVFKTPEIVIYTFVNWYGKANAKHFSNTIR